MLKVVVKTLNIQKVLSYHTSQNREGLCFLGRGGETKYKNESKYLINLHQFHFFIFETLFRICPSLKLGRRQLFLISPPRIGYDWSVQS